jgi:hypothetical protein
VIRAAILSAVIFALARRFDNPLSWLELKYFGLFVGLMLLGCMLALVYYVANSLACSVGVHSGLIWIALAKKTLIIQVATSGWDISIDFDPRTGPAAWILFVLLIVVFWTLRFWLRRNFAIEDLERVAAGAASPPVTIDDAPTFGEATRLAVGDFWRRRLRRCICRGAKVDRSSDGARRPHFFRSHRSIQERDRARHNG